MSIFFMLPEIAGSEGARSTQVEFSNALLKSIGRKIVIRLSLAA
jgi:hypothetical protein